jgi:hypothetical protein
MTMHILAHLYFGDLMRCVFCISDMFINQNKDRCSYSLKLVSERQGRPLTCSFSHGYTISQCLRTALEVVRERVLAALTLACLVTQNTTNSTSNQQVQHLQTLQTLQGRMIYVSRRLSDLFETHVNINAP